MKWSRRIMTSHLKDKNFHYKLNVVFSLFFFVPVIALLYFGYQYKVLDDNYLPMFLLAILGFSFFGLHILRKDFEEITNFSKKITMDIQQKCSIPVEMGEQNEFQKIIFSFQIMDAHLKRLSEIIQRKEIELSSLKDISDLCYITSDSDEILHIALERCVELTKSNIGSIMLIEKPSRKYFLVKAVIGHDQQLKVNDRIEFESSIAKYAVLNKMPLVVEDIEKDNRFGRINRPHYGTKSFILMPIKTSRDIIGVMAVSRKNGDRIYTNDDVTVLTSILSNSAFSYENIELLKNSEYSTKSFKSLVNTLGIINSSFRDSELLHAFLAGISDVIRYDSAMIFLLDENRREYLTLFDMVSNEPRTVTPGNHFAIEKGSLLEKSMRQDSVIVISSVDGISSRMDKEIFGHLPFHPLLFVPLKMDGTTRGILVLSCPKSKIEPSDKAMIQWFANGLALAIERNRLIASVVKRNQELDTIRQIGSALASSTFDIKQVLTYTMDMIRVVMNVEAGALYLVKNHELSFATAFNIETKSPLRENIKFGQGIPGYVAARGESILVNDNHQSTYLSQSMDQNFGLKPRNALCVPMISQGKVLGVIEVLNKINGSFVQSDQDLLQSIASSVSIAIENANLYNETVMMAENERAIRRMFQKFVPKEVLDKILHGSESGVDMVEELRTLTLINIDLRGFSSLSKHLGPQKTVFLLNHFFSVMGEIVFKHHGIVDKYLGDGFLALFGAPVSSVADADNAIFAAIEMKKSVESLNSNIAQGLGVTLIIGISIHTGEVVVGNIGFEMKMDYTVIGDSVNDVFRLQDMVKPYPNSVLVSENTVRASRSQLDLIELDHTLGTLKVFECLGIIRSGKESPCA